MNKLHHMTQKAVNAHAKKYLSLYRASRSAGTPPSIARWQSNFALCIELRNKRWNVYSLISARYMHYSKVGNRP